MKARIFMQNLSEQGCVLRAATFFVLLLAWIPSSLVADETGFPAIASTADSNQTTGESFWQAPLDRGATLPADQFYPRGRKFPYSGFSGIPQRDKSAGYNLLGPVYVDPSGFLAQARESQIPVIYPIGIDKAQLAKWQDRPLPTSEIQAEIRRQVLAVCQEPLIAWWYLVPEELRYWRSHEIEYLRVASEIIRQHDPQRRPIWIYEPNHRTAASLAITGEFVDIIGKGSYTNYAGYQKHRAWVRWSMNQQSEAIDALGGDQTPILVPELFQDPDEADLARIADWVRHDVVLGLIEGAKGVVVYSLFKRRELQRSYDLYYNAYAGMARELMRYQHLSEVVLFGEKRNDLIIRQKSGPTHVTFADQLAKVESASLSSKERNASVTHSFPALASCELAYGSKRFLLVCNSSYDEPIAIEVSGFPEHETMVTNAFTFNPLIPRHSGGVLQDTISGLGVRCYVFSKRLTISR